MFIARGITVAKWVRPAFRDVGKIPADAITADLRTTENTLSFWRCGEATSEDITNAMIAIAAARARVDKMELVWLPIVALEADGQLLIDSTGRTPLTELESKHLDVEQLDSIKLVQLAERVIEALEQNRTRRISKGQIKKLLNDAVNQGRIDSQDLSDGIRKELNLL